MNPQNNPATQPTAPNTGGARPAELNSTPVTPVEAPPTPTPVEQDPVATLNQTFAPAAPAPESASSVLQEGLASAVLESPSPPQATQEDQKNDLEQIAAIQASLGEAAPSLPEAPLNQAPETLAPTPEEIVPRVAPESQPSTPEAPANEQAKLEAIRGGLSAPVAADMEAEETREVEKIGKEIAEDATALAGSAFRNTTSDNAKLNASYSEMQESALKELGIELKDAA